MIEPNTENSSTFSGNLGGPTRYCPATHRHSLAICYGSLAVNLPATEASDRYERQWVQLVAVGEQAEALHRYGKGARLTVQGRNLAPHLYNGRDGCPTIDLRLAVDGVHATDGGTKPASTDHPTETPDVRVATRAMPLAADPAAHSVIDDLAGSVESVLALAITSLPVLRRWLATLSEPED